MSEVFGERKVDKRWTCPCDKCTDWRDAKRRNDIMNPSSNIEGNDFEKVYYANDITQTSFLDDSSSPSISGSEEDSTLIKDSGDIKVKVIKTEIRRGARGPAGMDGLDGKDGACFHANARHLHFDSNGDGNDSKHYFYSYKDERITSIVVVGSKSGYTNLTVKNSKGVLYSRPLLNNIEEKEGFEGVSYYLHKHDFETGGGIVEISLHTDKKEKKKIYSLGITLSRRDNTGDIDIDIMMSLGSSISEDRKNKENKKNISNVKDQEKSSLVNEDEQKNSEIILDVKKHTDDSYIDSKDDKDKLGPKSTEKTPLSSKNSTSNEKKPIVEPSSEKGNLVSLEVKSEEKNTSDTESAKDKLVSDKNTKEVNQDEEEDSVKVIDSKNTKNKLNTGVSTKSDLSVRHTGKTEGGTPSENKSKVKVYTKNSDVQNKEENVNNITKIEGNTSDTVIKIEKEDTKKKTPSKKNKINTVPGKKEGTSKTIVKKKVTNVNDDIVTKKEDDTKTLDTDLQNKKSSVLSNLPQSGSVFSNLSQSGSGSVKKEEISRDVVKKEIIDSGDDDEDDVTTHKEDVKSNNDIEDNNKKSISSVTTRGSEKKEETVSRVKKKKEDVVKKESIGNRIRPRRSKRKRQKINL